MSDKYIQAAFEKVCNESVSVQNWYVSLYQNVPYYGGPEEGGWWGSDTEIVAYQQFLTEEDAKAALDKVRKLADEYTQQAANEFNLQCANECEWLEERGLEADYLPEPDGSISFWVTIEQKVGQFNEEGTRGYE
ncbi:hypothetical protein SEA_GUEY18_76 [Gordonia phage Guey18]|nr:hypothetical protein SEA_GUEY18_76 [Gordonia phage Guey18]